MKTPKSPVEGRPPAFTYEKSGKSLRQMFCDKVSVSKLAEQHGTPLYIYSASTIRARFEEFEKAFRRQKHTICYSVKANSNVSLLRMLASLGSGFDVVSGGELLRVIKANRKAASRVVFSGVGKKADEMDLALKAGILAFNLESEPELELLAQRCARLKKTARIAFRVNPDVKAETHSYITTGLKEHKFGVPIALAPELYARAAELKWIQPVGVSVHIGSQITDITPFAETMQRLVSLVKQLTASGLKIEYVDAGGGLGIDYQGNTFDEFGKRVRSYADALTTALRGTGLHLLLEPGRSIVAPAGALVTRVVYAKQNGKKRFLVVDAAMNDLIRPSLYSAYHEIVPVVRDGSASIDKVDVVGPICETGDFFARDRELPSVVPGDLVAVLDAGAYGMSLSSNYNTRPRAAELMVDGKKVKVVRKRESFADLIRNEV